MHRYTPLLTLGFLMLSSPVGAFDYPEHVHITWKALNALFHDCKAAEATAPSADCIAKTGLLQVGALMRAGVDEASSLVCEDAVLFDEAPDCFAISDLPALSGDHSAGPMLLLWRWFDPMAPPVEQETRWSQLIGGTRSWHSSPETAFARVPDRRRFLTYMRKFASPTWRAGRKPDNEAIAATDDTYLSILLRMTNHFRPRMKSPEDVFGEPFESTRVALIYGGRDDRHKPQNNAFAWYADLHLGALTYAQMASTASTDQRQHLLGIAFFLELTALHFIQDMVAPGHITSDTTKGSLSTNLTHDRDNHGGMVVRLPKELCDAATHVVGCHTPLCDKTTTMIYGDGALETLGSSADVTPDAVRPTQDWAITLTYLSLDELVKAATPRTAAPDAPSSTPSSTSGDPTWFRPLCQGTEPPRDAEWDRFMAARKKSQVPEPAILRSYLALFRWWESYGGAATAPDGKCDPTADRGVRPQSERDHLLSEAWKQGSNASGPFRALRLVPNPLGGLASDYPPVEAYAGHGSSIRTTFFHTKARAHAHDLERLGQSIVETRMTYRVTPPRIPLFFEGGLGLGALRTDEGERGVAVHAVGALGVTLADLAYVQFGLGVGRTLGANAWTGMWDLELGLNLENVSNSQGGVAFVIGGGDEHGVVIGGALRFTVRVDRD